MDLHAYVHGDEKVVLDISERDRDAFDGLPRGGTGQSVVVRDVTTGEHWRVRRWPCGLACYCAAKADLVDDERSTR